MTNPTPRLLPLQRVLALTAVDRTLGLRELDPDFRWSRPVRWLLAGGLAAGTALAVVVTGAVVVLLPAAVARLEVSGDELLVLTLAGALVVLVRAASAVSGREVRTGVRDFDADLLDAAGFRRAEVVAARLALPALGSAALTTWVALATMLPLAGRYPAGSFPAALGCVLVAVVAGLVVRAAGTVAFLASPRTTWRTRAAALLVSFMVGTALPVVLVAAERATRSFADDPRQALVEAGSRLDPAAVLAAETLLLLACAAALTLGVRRLRRDGADAGPDALPAAAPRRGTPLLDALTRSPRRMLLAAPVLRLSRERDGDTTESATVLRWSAYALALIAGVTTTGLPFPWQTRPEAAPAALAALAFVAAAAVHPTASLLAQRGTRVVLYAAELPRPQVSALLIASHAVVSAPASLAATLAVCWAVPDLPVPVAAASTVGGLAVAVCAHFVADALLPATQNASDTRIRQTLPQRFVTVSLVGVGTGALSALISRTGTASGGSLGLALAACGAAVLGAVTSLAVDPRPWRQS